jgi:SAM-dependent methyltransferase
MSKYVLPRDWLVNRLEENLKSAFATHSIQKVLVLGGGPREPELSLLSGIQVQYYFAGIENEEKAQNFHYLDLNILTYPLENFDLVICNQVLEHLHNLQNAFENIARLVKPQGLLWLTCPASNYRHGSPNFYSAGYSWEFLSTNLENIGFKTLDSGELCSKRIYLFRHLLRLWPSSFQARYPLVAYFGISGNYGEKIAFNLRSISSRVIISLASKKWELSGSYPLETFGFYKKSA